MKKVIITAGPIPARLDSVKYLTNRFRGGLAMSVAQALFERWGVDVTVVRWEHSVIATNGLPEILVKDVMDYREKVLSIEADAYILSAAVSNLMPSRVIEGKFPSHLYKVGDKFNIEFQIAPRIIDEIKNLHPRSTLIGYKLFDGIDAELISAARHTLFQSKANIVFANHPKWAKVKKIAVTSDGSAFEVTFDQHLELIEQLVNHATWYKTSFVNWGKTIEPIFDDEKFLISNYPRTSVHGHVFGTFAVRREGNSFITTSRGHLDSRLVFISHVDQKENIIHSNIKATLNAPLLYNIFLKNPEINYIIHDHKFLSDYPVTNCYEFPGTVEDTNNAPSNQSEFVLNLKHHGYIAGFSSFERCRKFIEENQNEK